MANKLIAAGLLATLLVACASPEERATKFNPNHGPYCEFLGYTPDTDAWRNCIEQEQSQVPGTVNPKYGQPK